MKIYYQCNNAYHRNRESMLLQGDYHSIVKTLTTIKVCCGLNLMCIAGKDFPRESDQHSGLQVHLYAG